MLFPAIMDVTLGFCSTDTNIHFMLLLMFDAVFILSLLHSPKDVDL